MNDVPADSAIAFDDAAAYERFMGRWSRAAGVAFLDWLAPPCGARWLEVGCGTGAFTGLVHKRCAPSAMTAIDPMTAQVEYCRRQPIADCVQFQVADVTSLPFADRSFDVIAHALVLNFIPEVRCALQEMVRVGRPGGFVAGYVWDFTSERAPNSCIGAALREMGHIVPRMPGVDKSTLHFLHASFEHAGFKEIASASFEVSVAFRDFEEFWHANTPAFSPLTPIIKSLNRDERATLGALVRKKLATDRDGRVCGSARANAIKARLP
jgi:ubiquinone/menaquinone biosynthesis C-methylase UbiE